MWENEASLNFHVGIRNVDETPKRDRKTQICSGYDSESQSRLIRRYQDPFKDVLGTVITRQEKNSDVREVGDDD